MPTKAEHTSVTPIPTHSSDTPLHLDSDSGFKLTGLKINETLEEVGEPLYSIPRDAKILNTKPEEIRKFFLPSHYSEHEIQLRNETAIEYGLNYIRRSEFRQSARLAHSDFKRSLLVEALEAVILGPLSSILSCVMNIKSKMVGVVLLRS